MSDNNLMIGFLTINTIFTVGTNCFNLYSIIKRQVNTPSLINIHENEKISPA